MHIRRLAPSDAAAFQSLRLEGLREAPAAFTASFEEESALPLSEIERRLLPVPGRHCFGAFDGEALVATARVERDSSAKQSHRAHIRGVYVALSHRGQGVARRLLARCLQCAASLHGVSHVNLAVTAGNAPAQRLYESMGFKAWGCEPAALVVGGVLYDEIPMSMQLAPARAGA